MVDLFLQEWISQSDVASRAKSEIWDAMRSPFRAKHINDSMFIEDLIMWRHYGITLKKQCYYVPITIVAW